MAMATRSVRRTVPHSSPLQAEGKMMPARWPGIIDNREQEPTFLAWRAGPGRGRGPSNLLYVLGLATLRAGTHERAANESCSFSRCGRQAGDERGMGERHSRTLLTAHDLNLSFELLGERPDQACA